jgi:peptidoglycan/LPS O-acetylase OafA/YrhL
MNALIRPFEAWDISVKSWMGIAGMFALSLLATYVLYRVVETPFMRLRDRYFPYK